MFHDWCDANLVKILSAGSINQHFVEERLGGFSGGMTSAQTLMKLAQMNALVSYIVWTFNAGSTNDELTYIHPMTWKSALKHEGLVIPKGCNKKEVTLAYVRNREPKFVVELNKVGKPQPWSYDEADAFCIARAGFLKLAKGKKDFSSTSSDE